MNRKIWNQFFSIVIVLLFLGCSQGNPISSVSPIKPIPITGTLSYSNIVTSIDTPTNGMPFWTNISNSTQTLTYEISPTNSAVSIDPNTGEIAISNNTPMSNQFTVIAIGSDIYGGAIITTLTIEVKRLPFLNNVANVDDGDDPALMLNTTVSATTAVVGGTTYLFASGFNDNGVSVFSVDNNGNLNNVYNTNDNGNLKLNGVDSVATAQVAGTTYLFVSSWRESGVSVFSVDNDGSLSNVDNVSDGGSLKLANTDEIASAEVGSNTYLFVIGNNDSGMSVFSVGNDGSLNNITNVSDVGNLQLSGPRGVTTAVVGGTTYVFVAGVSDNGVSVFSVGDDGSLVNVENVDDSDNNNLELIRASSVTTAEVGGNTYLFVGKGDDNGAGDNGVSVFSVANDGSLSIITNVRDDATLRLKQAWTVTTAQVNGTTYLFAAGHGDHGVSVFSVGNDGSIKNVANIVDEGDLELRSPREVTTAEIGGVTYLFVVGYDSGVSVFAINP